MSGKNIQVAIRAYKQKSYGQFEPWIKLKYSRGCHMSAMDLREEHARELMELLQEHFKEN